MKTTTLLAIFISATLIVLPNLVKADDGDVTDSAGTLTDTGLPSPMCGGVQASVTVSDSAEVDPSDPDCDSGEFAVTSGPNYSYSITGPGSLSGSGPSTAWTWTPDKNFDGTTNATITLTVTWSGTDCDGDSVNWTNTATDPLSITVHANPGVRCSITPPIPEYNVVLNNGGNTTVSASNPYFNPDEGPGWQDIVATGTEGQTLCSWTYDNEDDSWLPSSCGPGTSLALVTSMPESSWTASLGISIGIGIVDIGTDVEHVDVPANPLYPIFDTAVRPVQAYHREYGSTWTREVTPSPPTFSGTAIITYCDDIHTPLTENGNPSTNSISGTCTFINPTASDYKGGLASKVCTILCCPSN